MQSPVTAAISSLSSYGFPEDLLKVWSNNIPSLNALQCAAINDFGLFNGDHLVVSAPTSSGKTMVGELAALRGVLGRKRTLFLLPLRALVNDKHQYFSKAYGSFGIRTIRATGEISDDIPDLMRGRFDICLMTYEKFTSMALGSPHILEQAGTIVVDEVQMIMDQNRGVNLEFMLTLLRTRRAHGVQPQLIALSAVIGDTFGFERWLGARLLRSTHRPVPLDEGIICSNGTFRYKNPDGIEKSIDRFVTPEFRKGSSQDYIIPLVRRLVGEGKQVIVFRETKGEARGCALYLAENLDLPPASDALTALPSGDPSQASAALRQALEGGIAFHTADLDRDERLTIEQFYRATGTKLRVIAATTTLAMGVNTPAEVVVIAGLEHPGPTPTAYSVAEYKNMVGRAGRLGFATMGQSMLISSGAADEHQLWTRYVQGKPEDLTSHFFSSGSDIRSLLLRILASAQRSTKSGLNHDELIDFLEGSFAAFLRREQSPNWRWDRQHTEAALQELLAHGLVTQGEENRVKLTPLGRLAGESGVEVESIIRLIQILRAVPADSINDPTLIAAAQLTVELDSLLFPINKKSTQTEPQLWSSELQKQRVAPGVVGALHNWTTEQHHPTLRAKKAVSCLYWISDTSLADIESALTQFGGSWDGAAGPVRAVAMRTADLLVSVTRVAELLHDKLDLSQNRVRLITRLQVGVSNKTTEIAKLFGNNLSRGDYLNLVRAGIFTKEAIENTSSATLEATLGVGSGAEQKVQMMNQILEDQKRWGKSDSQKVVPLPAYEY